MVQKSFASYCQYTKSTKHYHRTGNCVACIQTKEIDNDYKSLQNIQ